MPLPGEALLQTGLAYVGFVLAAVVGPGIAVQRLCRVRVDPALVLPSGFALASALYWLSLISGIAWLFPVGVLLLDAAALLGPARLSWAPGPSLRGALLPLLAVVAFLALTAYPYNTVVDDGSFVADGLHPGDAAFHVGLTWELTHSYPPQTPGLAGVPLGYHLGQALLRAAATRWAGIHPYDALSRFDNTLGALALILILRACAAALGASALGITLAGFAPLASDLAFLFAWGRGIEWWISLFEGSVGIASMLQANSLIPALAMAMGCVIALARWESAQPADHSRGRSFEAGGLLVLAAGLALASAFFKVFVAAQLLLGLGVSLLMAPRRRELWIIAVPAGFAILGLVLGAGGETIAVSLDPLTVVRDAAIDLGLPDFSPLAFAVWGVVWIMAALGLRAVGVPVALSAVRRGSAAARTLAVIALSGWVFGLSLRISPIESAQRVRPFNEALYFFEQSGIVLWVFAALALGRMATRRTATVIGLSAALALPTTVHFAIQKHRTPSQVLARDAVEAARALGAVSQPGDVILQPPQIQRFPPAPMVLIPGRVPYTRAIPFFTQILSQRERRTRYARARSFFEAHDSEEAHGIAVELGARYVFDYGRRGFGFEPGEGFELIYEAKQARVYRVVD